MPATTLKMPMMVLSVILSTWRKNILAPIAASYPVWALIGAKLILHDVEKITLKTVVGILSVVAGTAAIHLGK